jgi:uncharacterized RDD family membrane protein YckC
VDRLPPHPPSLDPAPDPQPVAGIGPGDEPVSSEKEENRIDDASQISAPIVEENSKLEVRNSEAGKASGTAVLPWHLVGFAPRFAAFIVDITVIAMLAIVFTLGGMIASRQGEGYGPDISPLFNNLDAYAPLLLISLILVSMTYFTYFHGAIGQTAGKMILGLRVVREDGGPLGYRRALLRWLGYFLSIAFLALGFVWIMLDRKKQAWHDKLAGSVVVWS